MATAPTKRLLPCAFCGKEAEVDSTQAGLQIKCACGADLDVPTMRGLKDLRPAAVQPTAPSRAKWEPWNGLLFVSAVIIVIGGIMLVANVGRPITGPPPSEIKADYAKTNMPPGDTMLDWYMLRGGIEMPEKTVLGDYLEGKAIRYRQLIEDRKRWAAVGGLVSLVGLVLLGVSFVIRPSPKKRR